MRKSIDGYFRENHFKSLGEEEPEISVRSVSFEEHDLYYGLEEIKELTIKKDLTEPIQL